MTQPALTFPKGGTHPEESKSLAEHQKIEPMPVPRELEILLNQHFGAPADALVKKKDTVSEGDLIGEVTQGLGANIHSSVTGKVKNIGTSGHPVQVRAKSILIETDTEAAPREYSPTDWTALSSKNLLGRIKDAGIVGIGGAGFPTHVKLSPPPEAKVDTLIINGAECEPYLTTDHRVMLEHPDQIIEGAKIILTILGITTCHIGVEVNKSDAIEALTDAALKTSSGGTHIEVNPLMVKYPQGSEKQLIEGITGRRVPGFGLPFDVGVIVQNVGTTKAIYDAVVLEKPLYEKVITVSGRGIARTANLRVKVGTRVSDIAEFLGGPRRI
ncbi:MAG: RnfABCDGE type electron transport complex subunit C [Deltaproteobacteria bacterium]|nr:RnfABCDGE type electron transport complex subunit C [Deltaproteobacteria bacterium]